jgi:citrate synthase
MDGLENVVAAETTLSDVDGLGGRLVIKGYAVEDIAGRFSFEDAAHLLLDGLIEPLPDGARLARRLAKARVDVFAEIKALDAELLGRPTFDALRALVARLPDGDELEVALRLLAAPAVFTPAILRSQKGLAPIEPSPRLGQAADLLRMLKGAAPSKAETAALDAYLVTIVDHGFNASTFAARVAASTRAGLTSAALAGLSALKGPLHGGAPGPVIDMLDEIGAADRALEWLEAALERGDRLMGFGHRIYRVRDPRADALKRAVQVLSRGSNVLPGRLALAEAVEAAALDVLTRKKPDRPLKTNVEFYTAILLEALGFPPDAFTCVFATGRMAGWIAHAREQVLSGRLIRPQSRYVGPAPREAA